MFSVGSKLSAVEIAVLLFSLITIRLLSVAYLLLGSCHIVDVLSQAPAREYTQVRMKGEHARVVQEITV
jgi:hypothetical protein